VTDDGTSEPKAFPWHKVSAIVWWVGMAVCCWIFFIEAWWDDDWGWMGGWLVVAASSVSAGRWLYTTPGTEYLLPALIYLSSAIVGLCLLPIGSLLWCASWAVGALGVAVVLISLRRMSPGR